MDNGTLIGSLALATLVIGLAIGVFMLVRARRSQHKRGEHLSDDDLLLGASRDPSTAAQRGGHDRTPGAAP